MEFCAENMRTLQTGCLVSISFQYGITFDRSMLPYLILALRSQMIEYSREKIYRHALEYLEPARSESKKGVFLRQHLTVIGLFEGPWFSGHIFAAIASPRTLTKKKKKNDCVMSPSSAVQRDTKLVIFE